MKILLWSTYYIINNGAIRSIVQEAGEIESRLADRLIELSGSSCSRLRSTNTSCLWENLACVATTAYCCLNNDIPY